MSEYGDLDNAGTGFALDENDDLEALLNEASSHEEADDEGDTHSFFQDSEFDHLREEEAPPPPPRGEPVVEAPPQVDEQPSTPAPEAQVEAPPAQAEEEVHSWYAESQPGVADVSSQEQQMTQPPPAPTVGSEPTQQTAVPPMRIAGPISVEAIQRVTRVLDVYRSLEEEEKNVASQFITGGEPISEEALFVSAALTADPLLTRTMKTLRSAKDCDPVDRAFLVMGLPREEMHSLGSLVSVFVEKEFTPQAPDHEYARDVVRTIEVLDAQAMNYVTVTERVLSAAEESESSV